ncbi:hypothetical protein B0J12DRAFT_126393 [Macrophomina phaseolina]|uniref:Arrestin C-terminal-like domain-containing protein n=1 Tax=Macrophomina phaseolina TaxID=35725 RepID=A0ABQ8GAJ2_9PEZI|nr:hypothetical protein B0J12DRAFT_126393 [Macrophomina phaseolina]
MAAESVQPPPEKGPSRPNICPQLSYSALSKQSAHARTRSAHGQEVSAQRILAPQMSQAPAWSTSAVPPWSTLTRPLSDIRELTEPSLLELANRKPLPPDPSECGVVRKCSLSRKASMLSRKSSLTRRPSAKAAPSPTGSQRSEHRRGRPSPFRTPGSDRSSVYSIPIGNVPPRSSSRTREHRGKPTIRGALLPLPAPRGLGYTIPNRGLSRSPVREVAARLDPISSDVVQRIPSRTFSREPSSEMLEFPTHRHPRVAVDIQLGAPLFVGGGSLEGNIRISIEDAERQRHKRALAIARISVDLLGIEEMWNAKRDIFMDLATEVIDSENPPPKNMVDTVKQLSPLDPFWLLKPSVTTMPFSISLPLDVGPPPFQSKLARIRYALCCTLLVRDKGVQYLVRTSQEVSVLSVYDRKSVSRDVYDANAEGHTAERALMSLPSPLTASDEYTRPRESSIEVTKVTAGLHRQVWVSGTCIFVDVHIANNSRKTIKKLELQLERNILCYKHTAAATLEKSAGQARIFDNNERTVFAKTSIKQGSHGWSGVPPHTTLTRTADLEIPRGHATVKCGKFFEVRYFLNIIVSSTHSKLVSVQLPIVLIHMNSLDVVPNSVAQVAAAIEEKRGNSSETRARALDRGNPRSVQGRAFAAPRMQSLDRMRSDAEDIQELGHILERSPPHLSKKSTSFGVSKVLRQNSPAAAQAANTAPRTSVLTAQLALGTAITATTTSSEATPASTTTAITS